MFRAFFKKKGDNFTYCYRALLFSRDLDVIGTIELQLFDLFQVVLQTRVPQSNNPLLLI